MREDDATFALATAIMGSSVIVQGEPPDDEAYIESRLRELVHFGADLLIDYGEASQSDGQR
jgi:hypothetical protein